MITVIGEITEGTFRHYIERCGDADGRVLISSPGGNVGYTLAMLDEIDERKRTTIATGICESEAAVLATAGEGKRVCTMDALFRFVPPAKEKSVDSMTGDVIEKIPDLTYYLHSVLIARLGQRLKWDIPEVNDLFSGEFISSTRAKQLGLVDKVISTGEPNGNSD